MIIKDKKVIFSSVLMGVPHTTIFVENFDEYDVDEIGSLMEKNDIFPEKNFSPHTLFLSEYFPIIFPHHPHGHSVHD